jgi:CRISPR-associated protein Cas2
MAAADKRWRLICYDIREPARWREVYKIVRGRGHRVQYSIYRARLDDLQVERLRWELARVMDAEDSLVIVDLCPTCASNVISRNHVEGWQEPISPFRIIGGSAGGQLHGSVDLADEETPEHLDHEDVSGDPAD